MAQDQTKKEALFNEVKGSLFEYLVARRLATLAGEELHFHQSLDQNYLTVLSQQDRMVRQFYPQMLSFLNEVSHQTADVLAQYLDGQVKSARLMGKFINSSLASELNEADLLVSTQTKVVPVSLKLNKRHAFVNTKSGGIRSFFSQYFPFLSPDHQEEYNQQVDLEFSRMATELHELNELEYNGTFSEWVKSGRSELPGELPDSDRNVLKAYYSRLARKMHEVLSLAQESAPDDFGRSLAPLLGFGNPRILQVVCFHDFKSSNDALVIIHPFEEIQTHLLEAKILPFNDTSSVELSIGSWNLQIRIKPMNKFTTTAIKINCSVKVSSKQPSEA